MAVPSARVQRPAEEAPGERCSCLSLISRGCLPAPGSLSPPEGCRPRAPGRGALLWRGVRRERGGAGPLPRLPSAAPPALTRALCGRWYRQSVWSRSKPTTSHSAREKCCCIAELAPPPQAGGGGERGGRRKERGRRFLRSRAGQSGAGPAGHPRPAPPRRDRPHLRHGPRRARRWRGGHREDGPRRVQALGFEKHASRRGFVRLGAGVGTEGSRSPGKRESSGLACWEDLVSREQAGNRSQPGLVTGQPVPHRKGPTGDN